MERYLCLLPMAAAVWIILYPSQARKLYVELSPYAWQRKFFMRRNDYFYRLLGVSIIVFGIFFLLQKPISH